MLHTKNAKIPMRFHDLKKRLLFFLEIEPHTAAHVKIPVSTFHGDILLPPSKINDCVIRETFSEAVDGYALVSLENTSEVYQEIALYEPLNAFPFNSNNYSLFSAIVNAPETDALSRRDIRHLIRTSHLNDEERTHITKLCEAYNDIFYYEGGPLTFTNEIKHHIRTTGEIPVHTKSYRYPHMLKSEIQSQVKSLLDQNIIRHSNSAYNSPVWLIPKKADASGKKKWRMVVNYRKLNEKTIDDRYPIPCISDILDKLGRCNYFTTLDLASGFHQIEIASEDIPKTAFSVENGHYEFLRMSFGLKGALSTFQRVMDNILRGLDNTMVYTDDILVYSTSLQEHVVSLKKVFQRLRERNLKVQLDKSEFLKKETAFLGHVVTPNGVKPNPDKITAILRYPLPKTTREIKQYLGLIGYYRQFIKNFAKITRPLTQCLKKGAEIKHDEKVTKNLLQGDSSIDSASDESDHSPRHQP
nr:unnamed protein product [Callosobruchus chinensis]